MRRSDTGDVAATTVIVAMHLDTRTHRAAFPPEIRNRAKALVVSATG